MAARARGLSLSRRSLLAVSGLSGLVAGCGTEAPAPPAVRPTSQRVRYGEEHGSQFAELRLPESDPTATVVLLHGGYWLKDFGLDLMNPLAERFTGLGFATWNVEYRRTDAGGGFPNTLLDVAAAVDRLSGPGLPDGLDETVVLVGHSAGGQLAVWAASRTAETPGGAPVVSLRGAVSLAGVLDLTRAATRSGSAAPVTGFMAGTPAEVPRSYALADPTRLVPAGCPVWAVHAADDLVVPAEQSSTYLARGKASGAVVQRVIVPGDHFSVIDPDSSAFPTIRRLVGRAAG